MLETAIGSAMMNVNYLARLLAALSGDDVLRAQAATKCALLAPTLKSAQLAGARESLKAGDTASAKACSTC